jgi:DNA-binding transcriptional MerR regulator
MNRGYVKLWRKSLDAGWIKNHKLWAFWTWCLMKASHKDYDAIVGLQAVHLIPGQFIFGLYVASKETGLTIREIRTILDLLKKTENLTIKTTNKFSVVTIINWPTYQGDDSENDKLNDKQRANKRQHTNIKEIKTFLSDSVEIRLSELLFEKILSRNPNNIPPNLQTWAKDIDLMIRRDKRTHEDIRRVIEWCQADTFWQSVILSTAKLRRQFDKLVLKMGPPPAQHRAPLSARVVACPACSRTVLSTDMVGKVCILCAEVRSHA